MRHAFSSYSTIRAALLALALLLLANQTQTQTAPAADTAAAQPTPFKPEELEQIVAPIALYPDTLLAQVFMASTYPLEVVQAARWSKQNPKVTGKALEDAMQKQPWDPSVKSLTATPQVLEMMNEKLDWTQKLGDAFLASQKEVLDATQRLRKKALDAGNLKSGKEQKVTTEQQGNTTIIKIEPAQPQVVYVPTYNPTVVYGPWPYAAYPPYYYYPPGYVAGAAIVSFAVGVAVGNALWGNTNWGRGDVNINVNQYNSYNRTNISNTNWQHNVEHRKGVQYRDNAVAQQYGKGVSNAQVQARQAYRGQTGQPLTPQQQQQVQQRAQQTQPSQQAAQRGPDGQRGGDSFDRSRSDRAGGGRQAGAFEGLGGGAEARRASARGAESRASAGGGGARGGGARGGGRK